MSRIDASINAIGGVFQLYKYEPFSGNVFKLAATVSASDTLSYSASSSQLLGFLSNIDTSSVVFSSSNGPATSYTQDLALVIQDLSGSTVMASSNYTVRIGAGRFLQPPKDTTYEFYKNEPIGIDASQLFVGSIPIQTPAPTISFPVGISFTQQDACSYYLTGTPLIQSPLSNYNVIAVGSNVSRLISTTVNVRVNGERVRMDVSGGLSNVVNARVGVDISQITVKSYCPPYSQSGGKIRYSWTPTLPDGLRFVDVNGNTVLNGITTIADASSTILLKGAITSTGIKSLSSSNLNINLTAFRPSAPVISNAVALGVTFAESVVFDTATFTNIYSNVSIDTSSVATNTIVARTLFATVDGSIQTITASGLPSGVDLSFSFIQQRGFLTGTPTSAGTSLVTFTASNFNLKTADISRNVVVGTDSVFFTLVPQDTCFAFIEQRSLSNEKAGYYTSPLQFRAAAQSGCNVTMSISGISGTGLTFTGPVSNIYTLGGTPSNVQSLSNAIVTATAPATGVSSNTDISYSIVQDRFTFNDVSLVFIQNVPVSNVRFVATPLSGLTPIRYLGSNMPAGLSINPDGTLTGTPLISDTSGTFRVTALTGFTLDSCDYRFTLTPDSVILFTPQSSYSYLTGANVSIPIQGLAYSGFTVSNYQFSGLSVSYGLTINSSNGDIGGTLTTSIPPQPVLPPSFSFDVCGYANTSVGVLPVSAVTTNPIVNRSYLFTNRDLWTFPVNPIGDIKLYTADTTPTSWSSSNVEYIDEQGSNSNGVSIGSQQVSQFRVKNTSLDSNVFLATTTSDRYSFLRSTDGVNFSNIYVLPQSSPAAAVSSLVNLTDTSTWFAIGTSNGLDSSAAYLSRSDDDGLTWSFVGNISRSPRFLSVRNALEPLTNGSNAYLKAGATLAYANGVLLAGGLGDGGIATDSLFRSTDFSTWNFVSGSYLRSEIAKINTDVSGLWVGVGSGNYYTGSLSSTYSTDSPTIMYSTDSGQTWSFSESYSSNGNFLSNSTGGFNFIGYDIAYGNGVWIASGLSYRSDADTGYYPELRVSSNGSNWFKIPSVGFQPLHLDYKYVPPIAYGPMTYISNAWNILATMTDGTNQTVYLARHVDTSFGNTSQLLTDWYITPIDAFPLVSSSYLPSFQGLTVPTYIRTGTPTSLTLTFQNTATNGPTFTSPTETNYVFYQYMPIEPIVFSATGTGRVYFFVDQAELPVGLVWNPLDAEITGKSVDLGPHSFNVYAKDDNGVSVQRFTINTVVPRVTRQQTSAGAYTYLVRQYVEVNAAQNARDSRTFPRQEYPLGKFMAPTAPDVVTHDPFCCEP